MLRPSAGETTKAQTPTMPYTGLLTGWLKIQSVPSDHSGQTAQPKRSVPCHQPGNDSPLIECAVDGGNSGCPGLRSIGSDRPLHAVTMDGDKLSQGVTPIPAISPGHLSPARSVMTNGNLEGGGLDLAQQSQDNQGRSKAELLSGMSVRVIDGEPAPPRMVRAAVGVMAPDEVGLWDDLNRILREHGAEPYSGYGTRLDDVAAIHLTIIVPKLEVQSLINKVQELRADHMPAGKLRTSRRRKMKLIRLDLSTSEDGEKNSDAVPRMLRCAGINTRTMVTDSQPVPGVGDTWNGPRATSMSLTVEVDPEKMSVWRRVLHEIQEWAKDHGWDLSPPQPQN